jgi:hypothetical protein
MLSFNVVIYWVMGYNGYITNKGGFNMGKTFKDVDGKVHQLEDYDQVDIDEDIVSGEISGYFVSDGTYRCEVSEETYVVAKKYYD